MLRNLGIIRSRKKVYSTEKYKKTIIIGSLSLTIP
jgi:hypothetical protein